MLFKSVVLAVKRDSLTFSSSAICRPRLEIKVLISDQGKDMFQTDYLFFLSTLFIFEFLINRKLISLHCEKRIKFHFRLYTGAFSWSLKEKTNLTLSSQKTFKINYPHKI
jgi:hypothetical protein